MANTEIVEIKRVFITRLDTLDHILDVGAKHLPDLEAALQDRLAPDMFPLGSQVAIACNQPRGFSQWCADQPIENLGLEVASVAVARSHISQTKKLVTGITADDSKLEQVKHIGFGPGRSLDLPARQYISDFLLPNFYFHIATAYAILRMLGVPVGKTDFMTFLAPYIKVEAGK